MSNVRRGLLKTAVFATSIGATLAVLEVAVRSASAAMDRPNVFVRHPSAGWQARPNLDRVVIAGGGGSFSLTTDAEGNRRLYDDVVDRRPVVLLLGDSFVQGVAVNDHEVFAWLLAKQFPEYRVVNLGVAGYGPDQSLIRLEEYVSAHRDARVRSIVAFVFDNDFWDVQRWRDPFIGRTKPAFYLDGGGLGRPDYSPSGWDWLMDSSRLVWLTRSKLVAFTAPASPDWERGVPLVSACVEEMRAVAASSGASFHLFGARRASGRDNFSADEWSAFLAAVNATNTDDLRVDVASYDQAHWNAVGHTRLAAVVSEALRAAPSR